MSGAASRRKGSTWERAVVAFLREHGHSCAERAYGAGRPDDVGDVDGLPGWVIECKDHQRLDLATWCDEAASEAANVPGGASWAVVAKRRGKGPGDAYVLTDLATFAEVLGDALKALPAYEEQARARQREAGHTHGRGEAPGPKLRPHGVAPIRATEAAAKAVGVSRQSVERAHIVHSLDMADLLTGFVGLGDDVQLVARLLDIDRLLLEVTACLVPNLEQTETLLALAQSVGAAADAVARIYEGDDLG